jgi:RimJ/RimL family protein N-acetyltransferase
MADIPTLTTERCIIEAFAERHLTERYVGWLNDAETMRFSEQRHRHHDLESCRRYASSFTETPHYFAAIVAKDRTLGHIGNINAYVDVRNQVADLGILIGERSVWGLGYGTEAWRALSRFLLSDRGLRKITAGTLAINAGMLGIMRRCGMQEDGRRRRQYLCEGQEVDMVYGALFRESVRPEDRNE